jgi:hypothetical protein
MHPPSPFLVSSPSLWYQFPRQDLFYFPNRELLREVQIANKYMKQCSISLVTKEKKIRLHWDSFSPQSGWSCWPVLSRWLVNLLSIFLLSTLVPLL